MSCCTQLQSRGGGRVFWIHFGSTWENIGPKLHNLKQMCILTVLAERTLRGALGWVGYIGVNNTVKPLTQFLEKYRSSATMCNSAVPVSSTHLLNLALEESRIPASALGVNNPMKLRQ